MEHECPAETPRSSPADRPQHPRPAIRTGQPDVALDSRCLLKTTGLFEAVVAAVADDDVIEHRDTKHVSGGSEAPREVEIIRRWCRIAGRMIVRRNDSGGVREQRGFEHFARLCGGDRYVAMAMESRRSQGSARDRSHITG